MRNAVGLDLSLGAAQSGDVGHTNDNNIRRALFTAKAGKVIDSMIGLDDLLRERKVGPDENVNVSFVINLCHARRLPTNVYAVKKKNGGSAGDRTRSCRLRAESSTFELHSLKIPRRSTNCSSVIKWWDRRESNSRQPFKRRPLEPSSYDPMAGEEEVESP